MTNKEAKKFYKSKRWQEVRKQVLKLDHNECQICKSKGKLTKAYLVHHIYELKDFPEYKDSIYVNGKRNLISVCFECHEKIHDRLKEWHKKKEPLNKERW